MTIAVIIISTPGSQTEEIMKLVYRDISESKKAKLISNHAEMYASTIFDYDYVIVSYPLNNWRYFNSYINRFDDVKFFSHVPLWKGTTRRGSVEIIDSNWSAWCIHNLIKSGETIKSAKNSVGDLLRCIPIMIRYYEAKLILNTNITELSTSVHLGAVDKEEIMKVGKYIDTLVHSNEYISNEIVKSIL